MFSKGLKDCQSKGGTCIKEDQCSKQKLFICDKGEVCCIDSCLSQGGKCQNTKCIGDKEIYFGQCDNNQYCCEK